MPSENNEAPALRSLEARVACLEAALRDKEASETRLREREKRFRALFAHSEEGLAIAELIHDKDGQVTDYRFVEANDAAARIAGMPRDSLIGRTHSEVFPGAQGRFLRAASPGFRGAEREEFYSKLLGRRLRLTYFDLGDKLIGSVVADVTDQKRVEDELRKSEERFRTMVETSNVGVWIIDDRDRIEFVNSRMADMLGYLTSEMVGRPVQEFVFRGDAAAHRDAMERRRAGQHETYERRLARKDGSILWALVSASPRTASDGSYEGCFATLTDITDRKSAEERLRAHAEMLDAAPSLVIVVDRRGHMLYANRQAYESHGYSKEEFMALTLNDLDVPESAALRDERIRRVVEEGEAVFDVVHYCKDRSTLPLEVFARRVEWGEGAALLTVSTDITERRRTDAALSERLEELRRWYTATLGREKRIAELKNEVNALAERLGLPPAYAASDETGVVDST